MDASNIPLIFFALDWTDIWLGWIGIGDDGRWNPDGTGDDDGTGG